MPRYCVDSDQDAATPVQNEAGSRSSPEANTSSTSADKTDIPSRSMPGRMGTGCLPVASSSATQPDPLLFPMTQSFRVLELIFVRVVHQYVGDGILDNVKIFETPIW